MGVPLAGSGRAFALRVEPSLRLSRPYGLQSLTWDHSTAFDSAVSDFYHCAYPPGNTYKPGKEETAISALGVGRFTITRRV